MKKFFILAAVAMMSLSAMATVIFEDAEGRYVSWGAGGLQLAASNFASVQPGDKMVLTYEEATDGVEFKVMNASFDHLAGSREALWINGNGVVETFLTQSAADSLKLYGLEIIGANFYVAKVELLPGKTLKEDGLSIWTGYFWVAGYQTLELYFNAYAGIDLGEYSAIRFYTEASSNDYIINFKKNWDPDGQFAGIEDMTAGEGYYELPLNDDLRTAIGSAGHWMIQFSNEALDPFNATDIVLVPGGATAIKNNTVSGKATKLIENGKVVIIKNGARYNALGAAL